MSYMSAILLCYSLPKSRQTAYLNKILNSFQVISNLLNSENLKVAIAQLCHELQVSNFTMLDQTQEWVNKIFKQNTLNTIVFKL